jgi:hypothetical protein
VCVCVCVPFLLLVSGVAGVVDASVVRVPGLRVGDVVVVGSVPRCERRNWV